MSAGMSRRRALGALAALGGASLVPARAASFPDVVAQVRPSLVAVGSFLRTRNPAFRSLGTGFATGDGRFIVTNAHVVEAPLEDAALEVHAIATSERGSSTVRQVQLVASDPAHDLAVLKLLGGPPLPALRLAAQPNVREGQDIAIAGFPLSPVLGIYPVTHRGIVSALVPIVIPMAQARQLDSRVVRALSEGSFQVLQLDITAYPGNSGSPVFDPASGEVLGVVNSVFVKGTRESALSAPTGITYAIPVRYVGELLKGQP